MNYSMERMEEPTSPGWKAPRVRQGSPSDFMHFLKNMGYQQFMEQYQFG